MITSRMTRQMLLPALFFGLTGFAQAGGDRADDHSRGRSRDLDVQARATTIDGEIQVLVHVHDGRLRVRMPFLTLDRHGASVTRSVRGHEYDVRASRHGRSIQVTVKRKTNGRHDAQGRTDVPLPDSSE